MSAGPRPTPRPPARPRWAARAAAALLAAGCVEPFQNPTVLDGLRVLGAKADPPEVRLDQGFQVRTLVHAPRPGQVEYRFAACLLEIPFQRGFGAGGFGGSPETIPSELGEAPPSCLDRPDAVGPTHLDAPGVASFAVPAEYRLLLSRLLSAELPDIDPAQLPEQLRSLLTMPDLDLLAVIHGVNITVSIEVSDGVETLRANKRVPVKLVPPPGPASTAVRDAEPGRAAVEFGWDADALHLRIRGAQRGDRLGIYLPSHAWDPRTEAPEGAPSNPTGVEGAPTLWYGQAARHRIDVDLSAAPPAVTLWNADGRGGWSAPALLGGPVPAPDLDADDPGDVQLSLPLALLGLNGRALAFLVALSRDGALVDTVPETGWRYVHGGPPNANPDPPSLLIEGATVRAERPASIETYALVNAHGAVVDVPERHAWSWFTDRGEFDERRTRGDEDEARTNVGRLEPGARWYVVVRDGRGGTAWTARDDVLDSGP